MKVESINFPEIEAFDIEESDNSALIAQARLVFEQALTSSNINFSRIEVCTNKEGDSIIISKVIIYSADEKGKILNVLGDISETYEVEIINE